MCCVIMQSLIIHHIDWCNDDAACKEASEAQQRKVKRHRFGLRVKGKWQMDEDGEMAEDTSRARYVLDPRLVDSERDKPYLDTPRHDGRYDKEDDKCSTPVDLQAVLALPDPIEYAWLEENWATWKVHLDPRAGFGLAQPLDEIANYYGTRIAIYHAWLQYYTVMLITPALVGLGMYCLRIYRAGSGATQEELGGWLVFYALFLAIWSTVFMECWARRESKLKHRWGTHGYEDNEQVRPEFKGRPDQLTPIIPLDERQDVKLWWHNYRYMVTFVLLFVLVRRFPSISIDWYVDVDVR